MVTPAENAVPRPSRRRADPGAGATVLLVAGEPQVRELLAGHLRLAGFFPMAAATPQDAQRLAAQIVPDVVVLDLDACAGEGRRWASALAPPRAGASPQVAVLGAAGADAGETSLCLRKPVVPRDLVRALTRLLQPRPGPARRRPRPPIRTELIELDRQQPTVRLRCAGDWRTLNLTWSEHRLLAFLLATPGQAQTRHAIRSAVCRDADADLRTVDQYVRRLRKSLGGLGAQQMLETVNGFGYRLQPERLARAWPGRADTA